MFDVTGFRTNDKERLLAQIYEMTDKRFALAEHLATTKPSPRRRDRGRRG